MSGDEIIAVVAFGSAMLADGVLIRMAFEKTAEQRMKEVIDYACAGYLAAHQKLSCADPGIWRLGRRGKMPEKKKRT